MAGQSVLMEVAAGDRVQVCFIYEEPNSDLLYHQVYLYTFTGLHDKPGNHLTQFMGVLLRPLDTLPQSALQTEKPRKRVVMSLE